MRAEEIQKRLDWYRDNELRGTFFSEIFQRDAEVRIILENGQAGPSKLALLLVQDFLGLSVDEHADIVKMHVWEDCKTTCDLADWGVVALDGEGMYQANLKDVGVSNCQEAFEKISMVHFQVFDGGDDEIFYEAGKPLDHRYGRIGIATPWDDGHGLELVLQDGNIIARDTDSYPNAGYEPGGRFDPASKKDPSLTSCLPADCHDQNPPRSGYTPLWKI